MEWLELHNVEYGECIVFGGKQNDIFMVDCGSINQKIREGDLPFRSYVDPTLLHRYSGCRSRNFLLTHYHRDHLCGLYQILEKDSSYFNRIYLPAAPLDSHGRALLLEFALFVYVFLARQSNYSQVNVSALRIFNRTAKLAGAEQIFPVCAGSRFMFDGIDYDVLWPDAKNYPFGDLFASAVEDLNVCLSSPYLPPIARDFMRLKEDFCQAYISLCKDAPVQQEKLERLGAILTRIEAMMPELAILPSAPDIVQLLTNPVTQTAYTDELNAASVIFHNHRTQEASLNDILMTGDAATESMDAIADKLYAGYYIVKAPHHGTASHWNSILAEVEASHVLISNGEYQKGGKIAQEYVDLPAVKHCTNCTACAWYLNSGCSCNRMACCYDIPSGAGLTIKCPRCRQNSGAAPCGIYIVSYTGERSCLCDDLPAHIT